MSKRYGRQQKRKAKAEMQRLTVALDSHKATINQAISIVEMARNISKNSICFEPAYVNDNYHRHILARINDVRFELPRAGEAFCSEVLKIVDIYKLEVELRESDFERAVHFRVGFGHNVAGYSISQEGLKHVPIESIATEITKHLKGLRSKN